MICNVTQRRQFIKIKNLFHPTQDRDLQTSSSSITNVSHGCSLCSLHLLIKSDSKPDTVVISSFTFFTPHVSLLKSPRTHIPDTPTVSLWRCSEIQSRILFCRGTTPCLRSFFAGGVDDNDTADKWKATGAVAVARGRWKPNMMTATWCAPKICGAVTRMHVGATHRGRTE